MDASALFRWGNALPAMATGLVRERLFGDFAFRAEDEDPGTLVYDFEVKETSAPPSCCRW